MIKPRSDVDAGLSGCQYIWRWIGFVCAAAVLFCSAASSGTFIPGQQYGDAHSIYPAVADLNGDGKPDFIVGGDATMVYLGNGDGTFTLKAQFGEGYYVQIGDFNRDGIPDFVTSDGPGVQIFLGNGDGSFRMGHLLRFPNIGIASPALGDFNHDGKLDVAVASNQTNQIQIFLGNGDGTFQPPAFYPTGIQPQYAIAVDLNHDGNLDLVVTSSGDVITEPAGINILLGNFDGTFRQRSFIKQPDYSLEARYRPDWLAAADFDGDGNVDVLVQAIGDPTTFVLYGSSDGSFQAKVAVATNTLGDICIAGDFDGDGRPDIVCAGTGLNIVTNVGNRTFSATTYFPGVFNSLAAGDFNQDGKLDLVATGALLSGPRGAFVYLNSKAPTESVLSVDQTHPLYGQITHLTAAVNSDLSGFNTGCFSTCPTGSITWFDGSTALATSPLTLGSDHSAMATYEAHLSGGAHPISFNYTGDEMPSTSNTVTLQVLPVTATLTVSASPLSPASGTNVTIAVAASASDSLAVPSGSVAIQDNGVAKASISLNSSGQASIVLQFTGGSHTVQASYGGDANYQSAVARTSFIVQPGPVQLALSCLPNPAASGETVSCDAQLSNTAATGSVAFNDGDRALGSAGLTAGRAVLGIGVLGPGTHNIQASYSGDSNFIPVQAQAFAQVVTPAKQVTTLAAADGHPTLAPQAIAAAYGASFVPGTTVASPGPLPIMLGGASVAIVDSSGSEQAAPLFYSSPTQINFLTPSLVAGAARIQISNAAGQLFTGPLTIQSVSPALFSANGDGKGVAAAYVVHVGKDGVQAVHAVFVCGKTPGSCSPVPVDLGAPSDQNTLVLYGSGIRNASRVSALLEQSASDVVFFGSQGQFVGLDQVNVKIPAALAGHGETQIRLTADGQQANPLLMQIK